MEQVWDLNTLESWENTPKLEQRCRRGLQGALPAVCAWSVGGQRERGPEVLTELEYRFRGLQCCPVLLPLPFEPHLAASQHPFLSGNHHSSPQLLRGYIDRLV